MDQNHEHIICQSEPGIQKGPTDEEINEIFLKRCHLSKGCFIN